MVNPFLCGPNPCPWSCREPRIPCLYKRGFVFELNTTTPDPDWTVTEGAFYQPWAGYVGHTGSARAECSVITHARPGLTCEFRVSSWAADDDIWFYIGYQSPSVYMALHVTRPGGSDCFTLYLVRSGVQIVSQTMRRQSFAPEFYVDLQWADDVLEAIVSQGPYQATLWPAGGTALRGPCADTGGRRQAYYGLTDNHWIANGNLNDADPGPQVPTYVYDLRAFVGGCDPPSSCEIASDDWGADITCNWNVLSGSYAIGTTPSWNYLDSESLQMICLSEHIGDNRYWWFASEVERPGGDVDNRIRIWAAADLPLLLGYWGEFERVQLQATETFRVGYADTVLDAQTHSQGVWEWLILCTTPDKVQLYTYYWNIAPFLNLVAEADITNAGGKHAAIETENAAGSDTRFKTQLITEAANPTATGSKCYGCPMDELGTLNPERPVYNQPRTSPDYPLTARLAGAKRGGCR